MLRRDDPRPDVDIYIETARRFWHGDKPMVI